MRTWRVTTMLALTLGLAGAVAAPAQAAPQPARHCVLDITSRTVTCASSVGDVDRLVSARRAINLVRSGTASTSPVRP